MSKSILVIDTPEKCNDCPCHFTDMIRLNPNGKERHIPISCGISNKDIMSDEVKPDWCPLREVPKKKFSNECEVWTKTYENKIYFIDENLGEKEKNERKI